ncbi:lysophospholipase [Streptomyces kunmingensis]|uniref:Lysophospholipase n=1 Tax=Streptomyces kunmingensis TaxID=68225 RepID=A0ABU6CBV0_9ACTN|nr:alpha/beta hydrolase [Streptomyces kunmingensis]MEB3962185.1 lysophospholipase [Streptomyces kunmingensis]
MSQQYTDHHAPEGLRTRGTVVVVPGRGETRATYDRLGKRLAADAYRVRVIDAAEPSDTQLGAYMREFGERLAAAVADAAPEDGTVRPLVLLGSDTGAAALAALTGSPDSTGAPRPDALVLAGLPGDGAATSAGWDDELDVRTTCPAHRSVLTADPGVRRGTLDGPVPQALLDAAHATVSDLPHLLLVGEDDRLADHDGLGRLAKALPRARHAVVHGARHDVLNDQQHRSVAAEIVTFLEALRNDLTPLVTVGASAW